MTAFKAVFTAVLLLSAPAEAETCRFDGSTSGGGRLAVQTITTEADGLLQVDVTLSFTIHAWATDFVYLGQEITRWRGAELQTVAVNQRTLADGTVKRQQWDVFDRRGAALEGRRVQAKYLKDFQQRHPRFASHWPASSFGQPWLADYPAAGAERRPDLDLPAAGVRTPLATAFFWSRFLPPGGGTVPIVLPGFKRNKEAQLRLAAAPAADGALRWFTPLQHPALDTRPVSTASATVSPDHYLQALALDVHAGWVSGQAVARAQGCQGVQIAP